MGVQKRGDGRYESYVYVPKKLRKPGEGAKRYVGTRKLRKDAVELFENAKRELKGKRAATEMTVREYSDRWLEFKHGPGTRRPAAGTYRHNRQMLKDFLEEYGEHALTGIPRDEALDWCLKHRSAAKAVSAMFNDAINDSLIMVNPFANRQHKQMRGRKDIVPIEENEVEQLVKIAFDTWGEAYGKVCKAWILWSAWVGSRPGETFAVKWSDLDLREGVVTIKRVKPPYNTDTVPVAKPVLDAIREMNTTPEGRLFTTVTGKPITKGGSSYYWNPVRIVFESKLDPERCDALREDDKPLALYTLRHFCASIIVASGGNEYDCAAQLGNTPEVCRETYIHEYKDARRERLRGLLEGGEVRQLRAVREDSA